MIAHQLWTIRDADRIVVLEEGRIAEQGTHDELVGGWCGGRYAELYGDRAGRRRVGKGKGSAVCSCCMSAVRTQVYFTPDQRRRLDARAARERTTLAEVVRAAVDAYLPAAEPDLATVLDETFGSIPDLRVPSRDEWDRGYG